MDPAPADCTAQETSPHLPIFELPCYIKSSMREQRRSSPQPSEEKTPQMEACGGRPRARELGDIAISEQVLKSLSPGRRSFLQKQIAEEVRRIIMEGSVKRRHFSKRSGVTKPSKRVRARGAAKVSKPTPERCVPVGVTTAEDIAKNYISRQAPPPPRSMLIDPSEI